MPIERLTVEELARLGGPPGAAAHLRSLIPGRASVEAAVREIADRVRAEGDEAVRDYTRRFDTSGNEPRTLVVSRGELDEAKKLLPNELVAALEVAIVNVALVAQAGVSEDVALDLPQGQRIALREMPVSSAAVYVPGGRAPYPSTVVMGVVTARAAGVLDVAVCSPPESDGEIHAHILGACALCGVERVYRMGGAHAIAALAYGTETVARVDVVVGPGNLYVQEAKRFLSATVGIDGFAGPSDLLVVLGSDAAEHELRLAALDMLAQGEHGEGSLVVAVSPSARIGEALAAKIRSAGCLFVGASSATAFGDYVAGSNHVLPTAGAARFASTLSARHFRRRMAEVRIDSQGAGELAKAGASIARAEGFEWHARSMEARMGDN
jgi:histidinol dehydrogenase